MNNTLPKKMTPALLAGAGFGFVSGIPIIGAANCACCAWAILGGFGASFFWLRNAGPVTQPPYGDGFLLGALTGAIGAVVATLVGLPFQLLSGAAGFGGLDQIEEALGDQELPPFVSQILEQVGGAGFTAMSALIGLVFSLILFSIFAGIGALIGTAIFHKKAAA